MSFQAVHRPLFVDHCVKCHGKQKIVEGKVKLQRLGSSRDLQRNPDLLQAIIKVLEDREMPPEDESQLKPPLARR